MPGVLIVEALAQAGGATFSAHNHEKVSLRCQRESTTFDSAGRWSRAIPYDLK